jgi:hypothetical protein
MEADSGIAHVVVPPSSKGDKVTVVPAGKKGVNLCFGKNIKAST